MKRFVLISLILCVLLVFTGSAWSLTVGSTEVGSVDFFMKSSNSVGSSEGAELAWVIEQTGNSDLVSLGKIEGAAMVWQETNMSGTWAISFGILEPLYYVVKTGNLVEGSNPPQIYHFLFRNVDNFTWGVIDLSDLGSVAITGIGKISHVNPFGVPEPLTMLLLGFGLVGLAGVRRFRK